MPEWRRIYLRLYGWSSLRREIARPSVQTHAAESRHEARNKLKPPVTLPMLAFRLNPVAYEPPELSRMNKLNQLCLRRCGPNAHFFPE